MSDKNPHCICIWEDIENCENCNLEGRLHCHLDKKYSLWFGIPFLIGFIPAFVGLILLNYPLNLISTLVWIGYLTFFFLVWEPPILCAHCPFYAEGNTKTLHCSINFGFLKTAKFKPEPANIWEKIQFLIGVIIIFAIPITFLAAGELSIGNRWIYLGLCIFGALLWYMIIQFKICTVCINFSCVLNRVPKSIRDEFLKRNPEMYEAWKKDGYRFEDS